MHWITELKWENCKDAYQYKMIHFSRPITYKNHCQNVDNLFLYVECSENPSFYIAQLRFKSYF